MKLNNKIIFLVVLSILIVLTNAFFVSAVITHKLIDSYSGSSSTS